jgi:hypothetical protein
MRVRILDSAGSHLMPALFLTAFGAALFDGFALGAGVTYIGNVPVLELSRQTTPVLQLFLKRVMDVCLATLARIFGAPVMLAAARGTKLDSRGPVIYTAWRVGRKGRKFRCLKFRTMVVDADQKKDDLRHMNQRDGATFIGVYVRASVIWHRDGYATRKNLGWAGREYHAIRNRILFARKHLEHRHWPSFMLSVIKHVAFRAIIDLSRVDLRKVKALYRGIWSGCYTKMPREKAGECATL